MDLDLRDPSVHQFFGVEPPHDISDLLNGRGRASPNRPCASGDNVAVSMALQAEAIRRGCCCRRRPNEAIERIEASYQPDLMIFDLPSVLVNDDTRAFLKNVDCALIVVRANTTRYGQFDTCEREIAEQTNVLGAVLNAYMNTNTVSEHE